MAESFGTKLKRAFKWHWHLLALGAGVTAAVLSGKPDLALPIVAAGELAYLGFLGANERFQNILRGKELLKEKEGATRSSQEKLRELVNFLSPADAERFANLRARCVEFSKLRHRLSASRDHPPVSGLRNSSLEKMLWLFLRLLHHKSGLDQFRASTDEDLLKLYGDPKKRGEGGAAVAASIGKKRAREEDGSGSSGSDSGSDDSDDSEEDSYDY